MRTGEDDGRKPYSRQDVGPGQGTSRRKGARANTEVRERQKPPCHPQRPPQAGSESRAAGTPVAGVNCDERMTRK